MRIETIEQRRIKREMRQRWVGTLIVAVALSLGIHGCSRTVETETRVETTSSAEPGEYRHEETREETKTASADTGCGGVLSCGVNVVGEVIAFPFKAVGYLFSAVF